MDVAPEPIENRPKIDVDRLKEVSPTALEPVELPASEQRVRRRVQGARADRFETIRAVLSVAAVITMAGTIFFMSMTGWGNPMVPQSQESLQVSREIEKPARYAKVSEEPEQARYPWREPLPEVNRDEDDPFYGE